MDKLTDHIQVTNDLPHELCDKLIDKTETRDWSKHLWYSVQDEYDGKNPVQTYGDKELDVQQASDDDAREIIPHLDKALKVYYEKYPDYSIFSRLSQIRFNKYKPGTLMRPHIDHIHDIFDGKTKGIPVVSIIGCLNDDFEGADFMLCNKKIDLKKGDVLLFPSNFLYPHQVTEATKGIRYSFVAWAF
tara:strand:- start:136 stop:699 length:564 start_codon:yes stop_codon:yes gene_type:complete